MLHRLQADLERHRRRHAPHEHADDRGWIIVYPEQSKTANKYGCWNWFDPANGRGQGECALIAAMHEAVRARFKVRKKRTFLAGMSAGGALVAQLSLFYSPQWAGAAVHSGLPFGRGDQPRGAPSARCARAPPTSTRCAS
jgi:poly(hydroxyalkanoate) depolymerase family esterase